MAIHVLVVDDSLTIRAMIEQVLGNERDIQVVGVASDAGEAHDLIDRFHPDVVTLDIAMPGMDGMAFLSKIMAEEPCPVLMVSSLTGAGADACEEAARRGAAGCFHKAHIVSQAKAFVKAIRDASRLRKDNPGLFVTPSHAAPNPA